MLHHNKLHLLIFISKLFPFSFSGIAFFIENWKKAPSIVLHHMSISCTIGYLIVLSTIVQSLFCTFTLAYIYHVEVFACPWSCQHLKSHRSRRKRKAVCRHQSKIKRISLGKKWQKKKIGKTRPKIAIFLL